MAINDYLEQIRTAVYGEQVRGAIHDAIQQCYDDEVTNIEGSVTDYIESHPEMIDNISGAPTVVSTVASMTDTSKPYLYAGTESGYTAGHWYYHNGTEWVDGGQYGTNGGINTNARNILKYILERVAYTETGMSTYVNALYQALAQSGGGDTPSVTTYMIMNALTHVTNSNTATGADEGDSYTATLTADTDYMIDSVVITMGGTDITSTAYSNGEINIASITGDVVITAIASIHVPNLVIPTGTGGNLAIGTDSNNMKGLYPNNGSRRTLVYDIGTICYKARTASDSSLFLDGVDTSFYPIPIPNGASTITVTCPSSMKCAECFMSIDAQTNYYKSDYEATWRTAATSHIIDVSEYNDGTYFFAPNFDTRVTSVEGFSVTFE